MMRNLASFLLLITIMTAFLSSASAVLMVPEIPVTDEPVDEDTLPEGFSQVYKSGKTTLYLNIELRYDQANGTITTVYQRVPAVSVTYGYYLILNSSDEYVGGYVCHGSYPKMQPIPTAPYSLDVIAFKENNPTLNSVIGRNSTYEVKISGGVYQITYNAVFHYNVNGNLKKAPTTKTVTGSYYFHTTGP